MWIYFKRERTTTGSNLNMFYFTFLEHSCLKKRDMLGQQIGTSFQIKLSRADFSSSFLGGCTMRKLPNMYCLTKFWKSIQGKLGPSHLKDHFDSCIQ